MVDSIVVPRSSLRLSFDRLVSVAKLIGKSFHSIVGRPEDFTDSRYYPPKGDNPEDVLRYFFFMVAIDHRTSKREPFEGYINGEYYHGADLLYRLGILKYVEDPNFFSPERMSRISLEDVVTWLKAPGGNVIWDPEIRAELLRDSGRKLLKYFNGSVSGLIEASGGYIRHPKSAGLVSLLKVFKAYSDPVEKKPFLFVKFALRRGLIEIIDKRNIEVPVDNHLTRLALRLRLVEPSRELIHRIMSRHVFTEKEDVEIRMAVREAYKFVSRMLGIGTEYLDDFLWIFGRKYCTRDNPICERSGQCPLSTACPSYGNAGHIVEHNYTDTFYY